MWDVLIVSASNETQAGYYRNQLELRKSRGLIEKKTQIYVVGDPDGVRIGSGGSTLYIINTLFDVIKDKKVLLIHSGGDSKRIPQFSVCGKLFSSVPKCTAHGYPSTLFDEIYTYSLSLCCKAEPGMLLMSGDVLIDFDKNDVGLIGGDAVAICAKANVSVAENHGVFAGSNGKVEKYLHKKPACELEKYTCDDNNNVLIDTGIVFFGGNTLEALYALTCDDNSRNALINNEVRMNLYGDMLYCFAAHSTLSEYRVQQPELTLNDATLRCRDILWNALSGYSMQYIALQNASFIHFGTTREFLRIVSSDEYGWEKSIRCNAQGDFIGYNSYIEDASQICGYIENSVILKGTVIPRNSIVSGAWLADVEIPDNTVISMVGLKDGRYCVRIYDVDCDTKSNDIWSSPCFPVIEKPEDCAAAVKDFLAHKQAPQVISFAESFSDADVFTNLDKTIQKMKNTFYLSRTREKVLTQMVPERKKDFAECELPMRINFAGGWTDTSPYANEFGGAVLNTAMRINNRNPIRASIAYNKDALIFKSVDLNDEMAVTDIDDIFNFSISSNNFLIHKAALIALGLVNKDSDIAEIIRKYGGFVISTDVVGIPKGSGLGTSSILCAAVVKCMSDYFQMNFDIDDVIKTVITMEQLMTTGGGWQDQVGGLTDGFKLICSQPGLEQKVKIIPVVPDDEFLSQLSERMVLVFTGQKRLARTILLDVMNNVFEKSDVFSAICRIKEIAYEMTDCFISGDFDGYINLVNEHWTLSKKLCSATSNEKIESIISAVSDMISGVFISGAGGGGYLQVILKKGVTVSELKEALRSNGFDDITTVNPEFFRGELN